MSELDHSKLLQFIGDSHRKCYGGTKEDRAKTMSKEGNWKKYVHSDGEFHYEDWYQGSLEFKGTETVYFNDKPVWEMNYDGRTYEPQLQERVTEFLRDALRSFPSKMPLRGPRRFEDHNGLVYEFKLRRDATKNPFYSKFSGSESITLDGEEVYHLECDGGLI